MSSVRRVFVAAEDSSLAAQLALARDAESFGLEGIWVRGPGTGHSDSYATVAAAAIASVTTDLRLGMVLDLAVANDVLRLAEDVAVLDHCSSGRAELWLDHPPGAAEDWSSTAQRLVASLYACSVGDDQLAVTPGPLQPTVSVVTRRAAVPVAGAGVVIDLENPHAPGTRQTRVILRSGPEQTRAALAAASRSETLSASVHLLRAAVDTSGAQDLVFVLPVNAGLDSVDLLASVLAPALRATEDEVPDLVLDVLKFRSASRHFVRRPGAATLAPLGGRSSG